MALMRDRELLQLLVIVLEVAVLRQVRHNLQAPLPQDLPADLDKVGVVLPGKVPQMSDRVCPPCPRERVTN